MDINLLQNQTFNTDKYLSQDFLYGANMTDIPKITKNLVYYHGKDSNMTPLSYTTEGHNALSKVKTKKLGDSQYTWDVMGRIRLTSQVKGLVAGSRTTNIGANGDSFEVEFADEWFIPDWGAITPDGQHQVRIQATSGKNKYVMVLIGDDSIGIAASNFEPGKAWVMSAPAVALQKSIGNRSNRQSPGKLTNQYGMYRYSLNIAGNVSSKVTVYQFKNAKGGTTDRWMPQEMEMWNQTKSIMGENELWESKYNRDQYGNVTEIDKTTGERIPRGAGIKQLIKSAGNHSTYTTLTIDKLESILNRIWSNHIGSGETEIVLYTGDGGIREFHNAIMNKATGAKYYDALGKAEVKERGNSLEYGAYFNSYKTIDNRVITVVNTNLFNHGPIAQMQKENGELINGFPRESYNLMFLDQSKNDSGERNIQMVVEEGREYVAKVYAGMATLPEMWKAAAGNNVATTRDIASFEVMETKGINMLNSSTSFWLEKSVA